MVGASNSRGLCCDMLATLPFLTLSHTHREAIVIHTSLSANFCPIQTGSIICSTALHKYMHVDIQGGNVNLKPVQHLHTDMPTGSCTQMKQARKWNEDGQMEEAVQVTEIIFSLSFSEVVILPEPSITFACLPVVPRGPRKRWRDSPLIQDAQFSGPK